jgi:hypothetical protein
MPEIRSQLAPSVKPLVSASEDVDANFSTTPHPAISFVNATLRWGSVELPSAAKTAPAEVATAPTATDTAVATAQPASVTTLSVPFTLRIPSLDIPRGKLTTVVGTVGAGKTALLSALLGEMSLDPGGLVAFAPASGGLEAPFKLPPIAYCAQQVNL